jgi:hypothetical protein
VEHTAGELAVTNDHPSESQTPRVLVELRVVGPGAAVDVVDRRVAVSLEVLQAVELAASGVDDSSDVDGLDVGVAVDLQVARRAGVVEERRRDEDACAARGEVRAPDTRERILATLLAFLDRRAVEKPPPTVSIRLVENEVAREVLVGEDDARVVGAPRAPYVLCAIVSTSPVAKSTRSA